MSAGVLAARCFYNTLALFSAQHASLAHMANPSFTIERSVTVQGGCLKGHWVVPLSVVDGREFVSVKRTDRSLARALGLDTSRPNPWLKNTFLEKLCKVRDDQIDALIVQNLKENDPMHDTSVAVPLVSMKGRHRAFAESKIPNIMEIKFPGFVTGEGVVCEPQSLLVLATPRRAVHVSLELTELNLDWLAVAVHCFEARRATKHKHEEEALPQLLQDNCKWRKVANRAPSIYCRWRKVCGTYGIHSLKPPMDFADAELALRSVRETEAKVQAFYLQSHCPKPVGEWNEDDEDDGGEEVDTGGGVSELVG
jgi:hypothetical protein